MAIPEDPGVLKEGGDDEELAGVEPDVHGREDLEAHGEGVGGDVGDDQVGGDQQGHAPGHGLRRDPEAKGQVVEGD